jgi:hypothetical protein
MRILELARPRRRMPRASSGDPRGPNRFERRRDLLYRLMVYGAPLEVVQATGREAPG